MSRLSPHVLLVALSGCSAFGPNTSDVLFETTASVYAPGDEVTARLVNDTRGDLGYNLCFTTIEARGDTWGPVTAYGEDIVCTDILLRLRAGERAERMVPLPEDLPAGRYRLATDVELEDGRRTEVTAPFEVR